MSFILGLCQMIVEKDKQANLRKAESMIREAANRGAEMISLPEIFNCPYSNKFFREYAEDEQGQTVKLLSSLAKELAVYLIGGSIPEIEDDKIYNASFIFDREGKIIGKHRKIHMFDIALAGGISMKESDILTAGETMTLVDTEFGKIGVAICYDVRFPELIRNMTLAGAKLIVLPAAFTLLTGVSHWDITMRARALDNQVFFAAVSPARDPNGYYQAYGHSCIATPFGEFCARTDTRESIVLGEIDFEYMESIREQLPLLKHRRPEVYRQAAEQDYYGGK
ncbi:MAG: carbon-nitrogen hydrolase family protein [Eubacteriales bacterium]|nr:carbon-nitrogen hydrolase family protein [Eubacteriales bacterium]MDD3349613.1 carbon-nitrogen hydrolase family protein [Eubacteriales bacterium]